MNIKNVPVEFTCTECGNKISHPFGKITKLTQLKCALCAGPMRADLSAVKEATQRNVDKAEKLIRDLRRLNEQG